MSIEATVTGRLGQTPELRFTAAGKPVCELSIAANYRRKNRQTDQWEDDGPTIWVSASLWEKAAERAADLVGKGDEVAVTGVLVLEEYTARDGTQKSKHVLRNPRLLGYIPQNSTQTGVGGTQTGYPTTTANWSTTTPQNGTQAEAPF